MIRIIGDVHQKIDEYIAITQEAEYSVQLGDMGFDYSKIDEEVDWRKHTFLGGNHDNYDIYESKCLLSLGDYGYCQYANDIPFFFVRGAVSIDCLGRVADYILTGRKTWWEEEELSQAKLDSACKLYRRHTPDIMLTHDAPTSIKDMISNPKVMKMFGWPENLTCRTQHALEHMWQLHQPKLHVFGHFHQNFIKKVNGTTFICLDELEYIDIEKTDNGYSVHHRDWEAPLHVT